jgi:hypothetical protein
MGQLADVMWGVIAFVGVLTLIAAAAQAWGADSRPCVGDSHTTQQGRIWI